MATAQAVTIQEFNGFSGYKKIKWSWLSTDLGVVTGAITTNKYTGELVRLITDPGATAPSDNYDITILDDDGVDALVGAGANRHTTTTQQVLGSSLGCVVDSHLTLEIVNAGDAKVGNVYLYIKNEKP